MSRRQMCGECAGENCADCEAPPGACACSDQWPDFESHPRRPRCNVADVRTDEPETSQEPSP